MSDFDKLSMELLMNKSQYQKYLSQTDPTKHEEHQRFLKSIKKHKREILKLTNQFLDDPDTDFNLSINEMFSNYAKSLIQYIEMKQLDEKTNGGCYDSDIESDPDDTLFEAPTETYVPNRSIDSFWGNSISKGDK
tara:strand:- start:729 stop:1133 length:405 start_codon:yes stop_codon:yes gene_type:complete